MASDIDNSSDEMEQQERPESPDLPTESHNPPATETESPIEADVSTGAETACNILTSALGSSTLCPRQFCGEPTTQ